MHERTWLAAVSVAVLAFAGCGPDLGVSTGGGSASGGLDEDVGAVTAEAMVLDLQTGEISSRMDLDASAPALRDREMAFRRVGSGSDEFLIAIFEVTQAQWDRLAGSAPWSSVVPTEVPAGAVSAGMPAFNLSYDAVSTALAGFRSRTGVQLDVPSDAQWSTACGGSGTWWWGSTAGTAAQLEARAIVRESQRATTGPRQVGGTAANSHGLHDMHGNVWEWTSPGVHVRGGSWFDPAFTARRDNLAGAESGGGIDSSVAHALVGVRLVLRL